MIVFALALLGCAPPQPDAGRPALQFDGEPPTNLLFLSIDTLRRDRVDVHGSSGITPFLGALAADSFVLDDHQQCSSWTLPGVTCTLAGRSNLDLFHAPALGGLESRSLKRQDMLADHLADAGYWSGLVSGNLWLSPEQNSGAGYDDVVMAGANAQVVRDNGLAIWEGRSAGPWFLHLHHMEPHFQYTPDPEHVVGIEALEPWPGNLFDPAVQQDWRDRYGTLLPDEQALLKAHLEKLYEGEIRQLDAELSVTWNELETRGMLDDTLVVIWTDHGEQIWEHGGPGHAHRLHADENDAVALFWAANLKPGRHTAPTSAIDLVPTVLDALRIEVPAEVTGQVVGTAPDDRPIFAEVLGYDGVWQSVTVRSDKLHYNWETGAFQRFDRATDRAEHVDLHVEGDAKSAELWDLLEPEVERLERLQ